MTLEAYARQLKIWLMSNADVPKKKDLVESLKINKEVRVLAKYVGELFFPVLNTAEHQTVKDVFKCLKK